MRPDCPFRPRPPWLTGDLQTVCNTARTWMGARPAGPDGDGRTVQIACDDGTGDRLVAVVDEPARRRSDRLILLVHGLTGCHDSAYMRTTARALVGHGYRAVRLNLRGAGVSRPLCQQQYHAGRGADLDIAIQGLARAGIGDVGAAIGYSLGGSILLNHLADVGTKSRLGCALTVSAPIDLAAACRRMMRPRNRLYHAGLLRRMRQESLEGAPPADLAAAARRARTVYAFDDSLVAPWNGFGTADRYYRACSALFRLGDIAVPTTLLHARDDPWIPAESYDAVRWDAFPPLSGRIAVGGGHVGFHERGAPLTVHDRILLDRLEAAVG